MKFLDQKGQGLTEYMTLLVLISLVSIAAVKTLGRDLRDKIKTAHSHIKKDLNFSDVISN